jgi:hypothetical protein
VDGLRLGGAVRGRGSGLALAVLLAATPAAAQISPGPLSRPHAALEGSRHCARCHEPERGVAPPKCLACHSALGARIEAGKGLHARPEYADCKTCHVEHQGLDFDLVWWGKAGREAFDHSRTGHPLEGRHARLACRECHQPRLVRDRKALAAGGVAVERTYLGLGTTCASCHADEHRGQFAGRGCESCHDQSAWKPAPGFDHAKTSWPLVGRHASVACAKCHRERAVDPANPAVRYVRFKGVAGQECASCHEDVHRGRLGRACASCHSPVDWRRVQRASFDHSRTGYPLEGRHAAVACDRCHRPGAPRPLRYARCTDCHGDSHLGQLARRPDGGACEACHDVTGFSPARFGVLEHQQTAYRLTGAHLAVPCNACHVATPADELRRIPGLRVPPGASGRSARFRFASTRCQACHRDVHRGELDRWVKAGGCESCHDTTGWDRAAFDHGQTRFALVGAHARTACPACHKKLEAGTPRKRLVFAGAPVTCEGCHGDPHRGQFRKAGRATACERCHASDTLAASLFDHSRDSAWPLDGAHARVPCASCHRREKEKDTSFVRYVPLPRTCAGCHGPASPRGKDSISR